jgi:hypothetical protein
MTEGVFDINSKQRRDDATDIDEIIALIDSVLPSTK